MQRVSLFVLAAIAVCASLVWGQEPAPSSGASDQGTLVIDVEPVLVPFTVTDLDGRLVTDLIETDFRVYEDGVRQEITSFESQTELPLTLALLLDTSNSTRLKLDFEKKAAAEFFYTLIGRRRDQGMLVTFDDKVQVIQDFTDSPEALGDALRELQVGGASSMYDAIYLSIAQKINQQPSQARRIVVVVSDGDDNYSLKKIEDVGEIAQKNDVAIYTISTNGTADFDARRQRRGDDLLEELADETGGRAFYPAELAEMVGTLQNIIDELRSQYTLTYRSSDRARDGSYRRIEVRTVDLGYHVTARKGYYAPTN